MRQSFETDDCVVKTLTFFAEIGDHLRNIHSFSFAESRWAKKSLGYSSTDLDYPLIIDFERKRMELGAYLVELLQRRYSEIGTLSALV